MCRNNHFVMRSLPRHSVTRKSSMIALDSESSSEWQYALRMRFLFYFSVAKMTHLSSSGTNGNP